MQTKEHYNNYYKNNKIERISYQKIKAINFKEKNFGLTLKQAERYGIKNVVLLAKRSKGLCELCGTVRKHTMAHHIHHIDETGNTSWYKAIGYKTNNNINNLILLCCKCHFDVHKDKISLNNFLTLNI